MHPAADISPSSRFTERLNRYAATVRWLSLGLILVSLLLVIRRLPVAALVEALRTQVRTWGAWGPIAFGLGYVAAVVLLVPASALTLAAGALFGLAMGTLTASVASTTGVALVFLLSRYLARDWVARKVRRYRLFEAIDRAITKGGWKVVALMRLSPAVPFNLQNYLYGVSGLSFRECVLTSWLAMLPGTFLYAYLGYLRRAGLEATAGQERSQTPAEWALLAVGFLATVAVTVLVTRLARQALRERMDANEPFPGSAATPEAQAGNGWGWRTTVAAILGLAALSGAAAITLSPTLPR
jgi:uncharacterized membrane protein YdjX (TVP38/TMEM64 family)